MGGMSEQKERPAARLSRPVIELDLNRELETVRAGAAYHGADHAAETLVKEEGLRLVLIAFKPGGRVHEHKAQVPITIQLLSGSLRLSVDGRPLDLAPGSVVAIDAEVPHRLEALAESAVLLTLGG